MERRVDYDIIIPHFGIADTPTYAVRCLQTIRQHSQNYRLIFVDNGGENFEVVQSELSKMPHLLIRNTENLGFVRSINLGVAISTAPYVVFLNNDAEAVPRWLELLRVPLDEFPRCGISGPRSTDGGWQTRTKIQHTCILPPGHMLAFFCTMFARKCLEELGPQDEAFVPYEGFGGDDHYCALAQKKNWSLSLVGELVIPHKRRTTMRARFTEEEIKAKQEAALALCKEMVK